MIKNTHEVKGKRREPVNFWKPTRVFLLLAKGTNLCKNCTELKTIHIPDTTKYQAIWNCTLH